MFKMFFSDSDTYITDKVISGKRSTEASLGQAGSLDLFKLYGNSTTTVSGTVVANRELSRILVHFDLTSLKKLHDENQIDVEHPSFNCQLNLKDIYGGQPTPNKFSIVVSPLSRSFDEGLGRDVAYYADNDVANFMSSSRGTAWLSPGANSSGSIGVECDYHIKDSTGNSLIFSQYFKTGEEDLTVDVTKIVSGVLTRQIPDSGFRISFGTEEENDEFSYFVKRFASRHSYDSTLQPTLTVRMNDSLRDDIANLRLGVSGNIFLYNFMDDVLENLEHNNVDLVGDDCINLMLINERVSGSLNLTFSGSQFSIGNVRKKGIYYATPYIAETQPINEYVQKSGSLDVIPVWTSQDGTKVFLTGSVVTFHPRSNKFTLSPRSSYSVSVKGLPDVISQNDDATARVNVFDHGASYIKLVKAPVENPSLIIQNSHYQVRDADTKKVVIPFDYTFNSTLLSSDQYGMYFRLSSNSLLTDRTYVIDISIPEGDSRKIHKDVSNIFRVIT